MTEATNKLGNYRYRIFALVLMATTINYFDRSIVGVLAPTLQKLFDWSNKDYAAIIVSFKIAYGIGLLFMGSIIDRLGTRIGFTISNCNLEYIRDVTCSHLASFQFNRIYYGTFRTGNWRVGKFSCSN